MGYAKHMDAIAAEIARIDAELERDPHWQEFKAHKSAGASKTASSRGLALLESLEANPLYAARCKLLEAREILKGAGAVGDLLREELSASATSGDERPQRPSGQRAMKKRSRRRATKTTSDSKKKPAHEKPIVRLDSLKSRLARIREEPVLPDTAAPQPAKTDPRARGAPQAAPSVTSCDSKKDASAPKATSRPAVRRSFLSRVDVPEADVDIRPSRGSSSRSKAGPKGD